MNWKRGMVFASLCAVGVTAAMSQPISNAKYQVSLRSHGSVELRAGTQIAEFLPNVSVVMADRDPSLSLVKDTETAFKVPSWNAHQDGARTEDFFKAGEVVSLSAGRSWTEGRTIHWEFEKQERFTIAADLTLEEGNKDPIIHLRFQALRRGWFSVGYTGAPSTEQSAITWLWQPLVWQERRFPSRSFLSTESMCPIPATFVQSKQYTVGLVGRPLGSAVPPAHAGELALRRSAAQQRRQGAAYGVCSCIWVFGLASWSWRCCGVSDARLPSAGRLVFDL